MQLSMFDSASPTRARQAARDRVAKQRTIARDYSEEWAAIVRSRPEAVATIRAAALDLAATPGYVSIAQVWETARRSVPGGLDQNHRAPAARWLMATVPELAGRFRTRETPGEPGRAKR